MEKLTKLKIKLEPIKEKLIYLLINLFIILKHVFKNRKVLFKKIVEYFKHVFILCFRKTFALFLIIFTLYWLIILCSFVYYQSTLYFNIKYYKEDDLIGKIIQTDCHCRAHELINLKKYDNYYQVNLIDALGKKIKHLYYLANEEYDNSTFTCDLYNVLRRGKNQRVLSFSLFDTDPKYYRKLKHIVRKIHEIYPGWLVRIYYDDTIDKSIICEIECLTHKYSNELINNADFCNSKNIQLKLSVNRKLDLTHLFPSKYRFLVLGDSFVDVFGSRDTDSYMLQREVDAVNEWLNSNKYAHIMKDHPLHNDTILAGMWGAYNSKNRNISKLLFNLLLDFNIMKKYQKFGLFKKEVDQIFLREYVNPLIIKDAMVHDSYHCVVNKAHPWPTRRVGNCYVGLRDDCDKVSRYYECPRECRKVESWLDC